MIAYQKKNEPIGIDIQVISTILSILFAFFISYRIDYKFQSCFQKQEITTSFYAPDIY